MTAPSVPPVSERVQVRRAPERGRYERPSADAILDAGKVGHLAFVIDDQPYAMPVAYARRGDELLIHGSTASRLAGLDGSPVCFTVTLTEGLVLARSVFHHSMLFRSVVVLGRPTTVTGRDAKLAALEAVVESLAPGQVARTRGPSAKELAKTAILSLSIAEFSVKVRDGGVNDDEADYALPIWAGVQPWTTVAGPLVPDPANLPDVEPPAAFAT